MDEPGEGFLLPEGVAWPPGGAGDRRSRVVFARPRSGEDLASLVGARWEVERSRAAVAGVGGVGAGRYADGADGVVYADDGAAGFLGGGGGDRCVDD